MFRRRDRRPLSARIREAVYPRRGWRRSVEYVGLRVQRIPDTPHRIALGFASGVMASFTPFFGFHFFIAAALAWLLRGNVLASLIGTFVGNPITFPIIASVSLSLGRRVLGYGVTGRDFSRVVDAFVEAAFALWAGLLAVIGLGESGWERLVPLFNDIIWPYFVGGLLPGLIAAIASYHVVRPLIGAYQARRRNVMLARARARIHAAHEGTGRASEGGEE